MNKYLKTLVRWAVLPACVVGVILAYRTMDATIRNMYAVWWVVVRGQERYHFRGEKYASCLVAWRDVLSLFVLSDVMGDVVNDVDRR